MAGVAFAHLLTCFEGGNFDLSKYWKMPILALVASSIVLFCFSPFQIIYWTDKRNSKRLKIYK
jgi:hypothetical protein